MKKLTKKLMKKLQAVVLVSALAFSCLLQVQITNAEVIEQSNRVSISKKSLLDDSGSYIIKKGLLQSVVFSCNKIKLSSIDKKDTYNVFVNGNLTIDLTNYCSMNNVSRIEILKIDSESKYDNSRWQEDSLTIYTQGVYSAVDVIDWDWKGIVYVKVTDTSGNIYINKTNGFVVDRTCPQIKLTGTCVDSNKKVYKDKVLIYATDHLSGVKSIKINDEEFKDFKKGLELSKNGTYKILVTDNCGNVTSMTISVQKSN